MFDKIVSIKGIDHIGYAVKDLASAREYFKALGFDFSVEEEDLLRSVNVCVASDLRGSRIELLAPAKEKSPIDSYLKKIGPFYFTNDKISSSMYIFILQSFI